MLISYAKTTYIYNICSFSNNEGARIVFRVKAFRPYLRISKIDKEDKTSPVFEIF